MPDPPSGQKVLNHLGAERVTSSASESVTSSLPDPFAARAHNPRSSLAARAMMASITGYQKFLSPLKGQPTCRFYPSCSQYALEAVREHGAAVGAWLTVKRLSKCHPFHPGGLDPVPRRSVRVRHFAEER
jgi:hypothetical protein